MAHKQNGETDPFERREADFRVFFPIQPIIVGEIVLSSR
jgi:hypothetical protein